MTPNNIVNMAGLCELQAIALSDHNTTGNVPAFLKVAGESGLTAFAAMELETAEEIHVLCLFYNAEDAYRFEREVVAPALPPIKNRVDIFGTQRILDENDEQIGEDERYIINATNIGIDSLPQRMSEYGGIAIPAHIDKATKSMTSVLGTVDKSMGFGIFELSKNAPDDFICAHPEISDCLFLYDTDSHDLMSFADERRKNFLELENAKKDTIWNFLKEKSTI